MPRFANYTAKNMTKPHKISVALSTIDAKIDIELLTAKATIFNINKIIFDANDKLIARFGLVGCKN